MLEAALKSLSRGLADQFRSPGERAKKKMTEKLSAEKEAMQRIATVESVMQLLEGSELAERGRLLQILDRWKQDLPAAQPPAAS